MGVDICLYSNLLLAAAGARCQVQRLQMPPSVRSDPLYCRFCGESACTVSVASVLVSLAGAGEVQTTLTLGDFPPCFLWPQTRLRAIFKAQSAAD